MRYIRVENPEREKESEEEIELKYQCYMRFEKFKLENWEQSKRSKSLYKI